MHPWALWRGTFEAAPQWWRRRGRGRNLSRRERRQNAQFLESTFLTCCSRLVPLRFVMVFPCGLNFFAGPWAITPDNMLTGCCLRKNDYVMLSSDFCSRKCNHTQFVGFVSGLMECKLAYYNNTQSADVAIEFDDQARQRIASNFLAECQKPLQKMVSCNY